MIARTHPARRIGRHLGAAVACSGLAMLAGCSILSDHRERNIPQPGVIDPHQPKELEMVSMPPYVVEPPDELEIIVRPAIPEYTQTTAVVQADGVIDLGFPGDVYVAGLTLGQIEMKLAQHLSGYVAAHSPKTPLSEPLDVSVRVVNGSQSKFYYVLGTVSNQGKFPITGGETVLDGLLAAGLRSNSLPEKSYLVRPHPAGAGCQILKIDYTGIKERGETITNYQIFPGDRIVVPGGKPPGLLGTLIGN